MKKRKEKKLRKKRKVPTELTKYPCLVCGKYFLPYLHTTNGYALMICPKDGQYRTSVQVSANFRKFCKKLGSAPNRKQSYYTSSEEKVRQFLLDKGLIEGLGFFHNSRIGPFINDNGHKVYYWLDFVIPRRKLVYEVSPAVWHLMWARNGSDERKSRLLKKLGFKTIHLDEKDLTEAKLRKML